MFEHVLGVMPARGGSKGVHRKNLRSVAGESLISRAIRTAFESKRLTRLVTTTDDDEIASVACELGSPVRRRPPELATDDAPITHAVLDALASVEQEDATEFDVVVLLQPTSPLRRGGDVDAMIELLEQNDDADCAISVCEVDDVHPARMYRVDSQGSMHPLWPEWERSQRQELPTLYYRNGAVYATRRSTLVATQQLVGSKPLAYMMPSQWLVNIDDERDLLLAEILARKWAAASDEDLSGPRASGGGHR